MGNASAQNDHWKFIQNRHFIADYQWLLHWKCTVKYVLPGQSYTKMGQKMTCEQTIILSSGWYCHSLQYM